MAKFTSFGDILGPFCESPRAVKLGSCINRLIFGLCREAEKGNGLEVADGNTTACAYDGMAEILLGH